MHVTRVIIFVTYVTGEWYENVLYERKFYIIYLRSLISATYLSAIKIPAGIVIKMFNTRYPN